MLTKSIGTLSADIYNVLTDNNDYRHDTVEEATVFAERLIHQYDKAVGNETRTREDKVLYATDIGKPCVRQTYYSMTASDEAEPIQGHARYKFLYGDLIEEITLELAKAAGHMVSNEQTRYILERNGWQIRGRCDAIIDGHMCDVKSASKYAFNKYSKEGISEHNDTFGYREQLLFYTLMALENEDIKDTHVGSFFVFVSKELGHIVCVKNDLNRVEFYDTLDYKIETLDTALADEVAPARVANPTEDHSYGNTRLGVTCSYCPFKVKCWPELRAFAYAHGPVFIPEVVKEPPKVPEIDLQK